MYSDSIILGKLKNNITENRVGVIVSNKISKKATLRNKIKRMIIKSIIANYNDMEKSYDLLFIAKNNIVGDQKLIDREVTLLLNKTNLLK